MTMQEIEAGNNIIFEAAGEETNVIFGVVNKEEMTEYISYTVIATGFGNEAVPSGISTIKKEREEKVKKERSSASAVGGYSKTKMNVEPNTDLNVPTILRVKGRDPELFAADEFIQSGFKAETKDNYKEEETNKKNHDEEDGSSFLRKIMD